MCLKGNGCIFPCTLCMVEREDSCSASGADAPRRDVEETVRAQLKNATMGSFRGAAERRLEVELEHSFNSVVPAMAAWAGLGNVPQMLYRFRGFDRLHVSLFACRGWSFCFLYSGVRARVVGAYANPFQYPFSISQ